jgi:excinuclease ABC subunit A
MKDWLDALVSSSIKFDFPIHRAVNQLTKAELKLLWKGNKYFKGLDDFFQFLEEQTYKIQYRVMLSRYRGKTNCPDCLGSRLRKDATYVKVDGHSITDIVLMPLKKTLTFFNELKLDEQQQIIAKRLIQEINNRILFLNEVGLGYSYLKPTF